MAPSEASQINSNCLKISTSITMDKIWLEANNLIYDMCTENIFGQIKNPAPILLTELKWDQHNIKVKIFMELKQDWQNWEYAFKFIAAVSGFPKEAENDGSTEIYHLSSFNFDMKFGDKWESDDAYDITLGKSSQDLTEVVFAFSDILQCCEVTIHADCQQKKKERKNER